MGTKISWADESWNPIVGCSKISAGCANCYAERQAASPRLQQFPQYRAVAHNGHWLDKTKFVEAALTKPLHWRKPRKIFVCSMSDLFHESVPFEWIDEIFGTMIHCNARRKAMGEDPHIFKLLTKRSKGMVKYYESMPWLRVSKYCEEKWGWLWGGGRLWHPEHVHLGVTVENQDNVGRIADLIRTPAAKRFVSFEPLLPGDIIAGMLQNGKGCPACYGTGHNTISSNIPCKCCGVPVGIDYAFIGCESGPKARLCALADVEDIMIQCREAGVKVHVKQIPLNGKCNKNIDEWPKEFRVREV